MPKNNPLDPLREALAASVNWLQNCKVRGVVIGGVAFGLLGEPRATKDIDWSVLIDEEDLPRFIEKANDYDIVSRISNPIAFSEQSSVIPFIHKKSRIPVDVAFGFAPFDEQAIARRKIHTYHGIDVPLPAVEDLIVMKMVAHRSQDLADAERLLVIAKHVDQKHIRRWVREYADAMNSPEILTDVERLFKTTRQLKKR